MKKLLTITASLLVLLLGTFTLVSCGDDDSKESKKDFDTYAHYSFEMGEDLTNFYEVKITYLSLDGQQHVVNLKQGETKWNFDERTALDCPKFRCIIELFAKEDATIDYSSADYFDLGYAYKCSAYSPSVGIKVSQNKYPGSFERDKVIEAVKANPYRLVIDFPEIY